jgi:hypothetical protein
MTFNFVADKTIKGKIYPALAQHEARPYTQSWREFGQHWPYTIPIRLQEYCDSHGVPLNILSIEDQLPPNTFYPIGIGFFDFGIDYISLLPARVMERLQLHELKLLFYYHEGDNPFRIKNRLDSLCAEHGLGNNCYTVISGNSASASIPGFVYFVDFEFWYYQRNQSHAPLDIHSQAREREFTVLNRLHKSWRATVMTDMLRTHILDNSYWSYCETGALETDNPIQIDQFTQLRYDTMKFLAAGPYVSDELEQSERNDHSKLVGKYYTNAYCNIVVETHFDADQCHGTFITEKTFKPIKHGQMFFIAGPAGSLQVLRDLGYKTFDNVLDNRYDTIQDHTDRWQYLRDAITDAQSKLPELFNQAQSDMQHNQQLFVSNKAQCLNTLLEKINVNY